MLTQPFDFKIQVMKIGGRAALSSPLFLEIPNGYEI